MEQLSLSLSDVDLHLASFGIDTYPPIDIAANRTRLNTFYEEACDHWPELFQELKIGNNQFEVSAAFRRDPQVRGPSASLGTFQLTDRGPVLTMPLKLPQVGETGIDDDGVVGRFNEIRKLFFFAIPDTKVMRVGLLRRIIFDTGSTECHRLISSHSKLGSADFVGGNLTLSHVDKLCNIHVYLESVQRQEITKMAVGTTVSSPAGFGLEVRLDVNNRDIKPLNEADIELVLERAGGLWPEELIQFLNGRKGP